MKDNGLTIYPQGKPEGNPYFYLCNHHEWFCTCDLCFKSGQWFNDRFPVWGLCKKALANPDLEKKEKS